MLAAAAAAVLTTVLVACAGDDAPAVRAVAGPAGPPQASPSHAVVPPLPADAPASPVDGPTASADAPASPMAAPPPPPPLPEAPTAELLDPVLPAPLESLAAPAAAPAPEAAPEPRAAPPEALVATATAELRATSAAGGGEVLLEMPPTAPLGGPRTLLVLEEAPAHVRVLLPVRPNGVSGWVERSTVTLARVDDRLVVDLSDRTLSHLVGGREVLRTPVAVGTAATPTPVGSFAVTELVRPPVASGPFGAAAFGLTGRSEVLDQFGGGDGQLAVHGTNRPGLLGTAASNGCVRVGDEALASLVGTLPLGTPVDVVA